MVKQHDTMTLRSTDFYWSCPTPMPMLADRETDYEIGRCVGSRCWKKKKSKKKNDRHWENTLLHHNDVILLYSEERVSSIECRRSQYGRWPRLVRWRSFLAAKATKAVVENERPRVAGAGDLSAATCAAPRFICSLVRRCVCTAAHEKKKPRQSVKKNRLKSAQVRFHTDTTQFGPVKLTRNPAKVQATLRRSMESRLSQTKPSKTQYNSVNSCKTHRNVFQNTVTHQNLKTKLSPVQIRINLSLKTVKLRRNT